MHLVLLLVRAASTVIRLSTSGRVLPLGRWLYKRGYSTHIALYFVSACVSIIGFSMLAWVLDFIETFGSDGRWARHMPLYASYWRTGYPALADLVS